MEITKEKLIELHIENGIPLISIAKTLNLSRTKLLTISKSFGIKSPKLRSSWVDANKVIQMYKDGKNCQEIADLLSIKHYKVGEFYIRIIINKAGVMRNQSETLKLSEKIKKIWIGRKHSFETRKKISLARIGKYTGKNNPNWQGGKKHSNQNKRLSLEYKKWRNDIKQRDGKCLECGSREKLHAHHIISVRHTNDICLLTDMNNGVTLCKKCHLKTFYREKELEVFYRALLAKAVNSGEAQNGQS